MRCINKHLLAIFVIAFACISLCGCGSFGYDIPYDVNSSVSAYSFQTNDSSKVLDSFAKDICVVSSDINAGSADLTLASSGCLFNRTTGETQYSKSANLQLHPASTTKVMTALIALKYGHLDDILTASSNVEIKESGAQLAGFKEGDKATLEQVLNALLIYSANDAGVMVAEYISGSVEAFAKLMNEEALKLGATNTNFVNPHGLTDDAHQTTSYDLYLIFNEALKYDKFKEIIRTQTYQSTYSSKDGGSKKLDFENTNRFINGKYNSPANVTVFGGKTGTTKAAGACLITYSKFNNSGNEYISVIMNSESPDSMYDNTYSLLSLEN